MTEIPDIEAEIVACDLCPFGVATERFWQHQTSGDSSCRLIAVCQDCIDAGAQPDFREDCQACRSQLLLH